MPGPSESNADVTVLLQELRRGAPGAANELARVVYDELHRIAEGAMRGERPGHTLQPTLLVSEAFLRLADQRDMDWRSRSHFYAVAAQTIRRILVDHARGRLRVKRYFGGLEIDETAHALDVSPATVKRDWTFARAFLLRELQAAT